MALAILFLFPSSSNSFFRLLRSRSSRANLEQMPENNFPISSILAFLFPPSAKYPHHDEGCGQTLNQVPGLRRIRLVMNCIISLDTL